MNLRNRIERVCQAWEKLCLEILHHRTKDLKHARLSRQRLGELAATVGLSRKDRESFVQIILQHPQTISNPDRILIGGPAVEPSILLQRMFPDLIPEKWADALFVSAMRSYHGVHGTDQSWANVRRACELFNRRHKTDTSLDYKVLRAEFLEALGDSGLADCLVFWLFSRRFLFPSLTQAGHVYVRGVLNHEFILNSLFHLGISVRGLNFLLEGGLRFSDEYGHSLMLRGSPGSGKTTLALQIAADIAALGGTAFYFAVEHDLLRLREILERYGLTNHHLYSTVLAHELPSGKIAAAAKEGRGILVLGGLPQNSFDDAQRVVLQHIDSVIGEQGRRHFCFIDSINAIQDFDAARETFRTIMLQFVLRATKGGRGLVLVDENRKTGGSVPSHEEYVIDTVIDLRNEESAVRGDTSLSLCITKCRYQRRSPGSHYASMANIGTEKGFKVFPSPSAVIWARQGRRRTRLKDVVKLSGMPSFQSRLFGRPVTGSQSSGLREHCLLAIVGPSGTHKSLLARTIALFDHARPEAESCAVLSLRDHPSHLQSSSTPIAFLQKLQYAKERENLTLADVPLLTFYPGVLHPSVLLDRLTRALAHYKDIGTRISRLVIDDMGAITTSFPEIGASPLFLPALFQVLRTEDVSTFIVVSCPEPPATIQATSLLEHLVPEADYVITTRNLTLAGEQIVGVSISKAENTTVNPRWSELRVNVDGIEVTDRLDGYHVGEDGLLTPVDAAVLVQVETVAQEKYVGMLERLFKQTVGETVNVGPISEDLVYSALTHRRFGPRNNLRIIALDEFWVDQFKETLLCPLAGAEQSYLQKFPAYCRRKMVRDNYVVAVPYYLNFGVLCYRSDLIPRLPNSWEGIQSLTHRILGDAEVPNDIDRAFAVPFGLRESLNCLLLEMLAADEGVLRNGCLAETLNSAKGRNSCRCFAELFLQRPGRCNQEVEAFCGGAEMASGGARYVHSPRGALVWRHWFSTIPQLYADHPDLKGRVSIAPLPGTVSVSGEWYLGMVEGSLAQEVGKCMIEQLTSEAQALARMELGVGLPTYIEHYAKAPVIPFGMHIIDSDLIQSLCTTPIQRSRVGCYSRISRTLSGFLSAIATLGRQFEGKGEKSYRTRVESLISGMVASVSRIEEAECSHCAVRREP